MLPAVLLAAASLVQAQSRLPDLTLEELMRLDAGQVYGASERLQPVTEAPASISFITAAEIARYNYRTLADILKGVRGMYVSNDRNFSLIGTRGFSKPGDYNSRILLLVNGHRVNDNVFGQAEIGAEFGLDPAMIERVEVIRGPASSIYGDSAFFAVVNVITKTGASLGGDAMALEAGTLGTQLVRASTGRLFADGVDAALSSTFERSDGVGRLYFPAFDAPATNHGVSEGLDGERVSEVYGHLAFSGVTVTAAYGNRRRDVPTASYGTSFNLQDPREHTTDRHTLVDAAYGRSFGRTRGTFRVSFDRFSYDGIYPYLAEQSTAPPQVLRDSVVGMRWSLSSGLTRAFRGGHTVRAGVELIDNLRQDDAVGTVGSAELDLDSHRSSTQQAIYAQDEIKLARWLIVNAGLRYDRYERFDRVTPRAALIVLPSPTQSFKYLYGNAFRAPNTYETTEFYFGERVHALRPESIDTHEIVWERYTAERLRTSVSTYWYRADRLITLIPDDSTFLRTSFINQGEVRAKGLELEAQMRLAGASRALVSYALQRTVDQETEHDLPNSPRHMIKARVSLPGPFARSFVSVEAQYLSRRGTLSGATVSPAATVNVTVVQPVGHAWEIVGGVQNLLNAGYADPASSLHAQDAIPQNGRTARIGLRWQLKGR